MQTLALFALMMPTATVVAMPVVQQDPPLQVWLSSNDQLAFGEEIRVYVRTEADGHLVVLHADPEGRVRVLFPLDPFADDFIRGGRDFEIRDRENHDVIRTVEEVGFGTVYVAFSEDPFRYGEFSRGDHWDYRVFDEYEITGEAEGALTQIAQRMAVGSSFVFDTDTYYLSPPSAYTRAYDQYRPGYYGRHDHHGVGIRIGFNFGGPIYSGWPLHPYRYGYYGSRYGYDPFYYDPFYFGVGFGYGGFGFGFQYGFGFGGYYGGYSPYYYGGYYGPSYYGGYYGGYYGPSHNYDTNYNYTTRNSRPVVASNYRDRRMAPSGTMANGASRRTSAARARPVRASAAVSRRTPTTRAATAVTTRRTADRGATSVNPSGRRVTPQRSPTTSSNVQRATPSQRGTPTTVRRTSEGRTSVQPPSSGRRSTASGERVREYRIAPRVSTRTAPTSRAQRSTSTRAAPQRRATQPSSRSGTASRARPPTSSGSRATPMRSSGSRTSQARPSSSRSSSRAAPQRSSSTRSRTSIRRSAPQRSTTRSSPSRVQRSSPSRTTRSAPTRSSSGRTATRSSGSSSRSSGSARRSSGSRGSSAPTRISGSRRRN